MLYCPVFVVTLVLSFVSSMCIILSLSMPRRVPRVGLWVLSPSFVRYLTVTVILVNGGLCLDDLVRMGHSAKSKCILCRGACLFSVQCDWLKLMRSNVWPACLCLS